MKRFVDDSEARSAGVCSALGVVDAVAAPADGSRGSTPGAWATDQAPSRSKKSSGSSWYFE